MHALTFKSARANSQALPSRDGMPVAQQDQWPQDPPPGDGSDSAAIARLEAALSRIAAAAGHQQDQLRVAELTAQTAQYELETLLRERQAPIEAGRLRDQALVQRLDALIATVREALGESPSAAPDADTNPD